MKERTLDPRYRAVLFSSMILINVKLRMILNNSIELLNNKSHGLSPQGGFPFPSLDQAVPYYSQRHLADLNTI